MADQFAIVIDDVSHRYHDRLALDQVNLQVAAGEVFGLLGPNGGGKTTLFRLLATLLPLQQGTARIAGASVANDPAAVRRLIGITFQSPSLDPKLTVRENLVCQGRLYGLTGRLLQQRIDEFVAALGIADRMGDRAETLSGGLKRRVEIAKSLLHEPTVLLLDEPSTGLDPGVRHDLWHTLRQLVQSRELTILVTTHLLDEAEHCRRLAILDHGQLVAEGTPDDLRREVGGDCITLSATDADAVTAELLAAFGLTARRLDNDLRIEEVRDSQLVGRLLQHFGDRLRSVTVGRPTLEDVFIRKTGHRLSTDGDTTVVRH
ncbi:MAG: ATP-binding cassette domain-containing protein [Planctomycetaceae bacterium]